MIEQGAVTIVVWPLAVSAARLEYLGALLSTEERDRVDRIRREAAAREFVVSRGVARELLALVCGASPADIRFGAGRHGKPYIEAPLPAPGFNLSHSGGYGALAVGPAVRIGLDIEAVRATVGDLAGSVFTPHEADRYARSAPGVRMRIFFRAWVAKEAYLKATGDGLAGGLTSLELDLTDSTDIRPLAIRGNAQALGAWQFRGFDVADSIVGALAVEGADTSLAVRILHIDAEQPPGAIS